MRRNDANPHVDVDPSATVVDSTVGRGKVGARSIVQSTRVRELEVAGDSRVMNVEAPDTYLKVAMNSTVRDVTAEINGTIIVGRQSFVGDVKQGRRGTGFGIGRPSFGLQVLDKTNVRSVELGTGDLFVDGESRVHKFVFREGWGRCFIGPKCEVGMVHVLGSTVSEPVKILAGSRVGRLPQDDDPPDIDVPLVTISRGVEIGAEAVVEPGSKLRERSMIGEGALIQDGSVIEQVARIGANTSIGPEATVDESADIGDGTSLYKQVMVGAQTEMGSDCQIYPHTRIGVRCKIGSRVVMGLRVKIWDNVQIGDDVQIGDNVEIEPYARITDGVKIGMNAVVKRQALVHEDLAPGETISKAVNRVSEQVVEIKADAESWILNRAADAMEAAGQKRLDKRALAKAIPTLVETYCIKQLLRMAPPPTVAQLREMAQAFSCTPKYEQRKAPAAIDFTVEPEGWESMQIIGSRPNDVLLYRMADETVLGFVSETELVGMARHNEFTPRSATFEALMTIGKGADHPGGTHWRNLGWARIATYDSKRALLLEEIQTDLTALAFNLASELATLLWAADGSEHLPFSYKWTEGWMYLTRDGMSPREKNSLRDDASERASGVLAGMALRVASHYEDIVSPARGASCGDGDRVVNDWRYWQIIMKSAARRGIGRNEDDILADALEGICGRGSPDRGVVAQAGADIDEVWSYAVELVERVRGTFGDWYESALAGVLTFAKMAGLAEVWMPDYETKYVMAAYGNNNAGETLAPPRSVYTDLPKKFQATQVEQLPAYMDISNWVSEANQLRDERWPTVKIPSAPRGRRLLANRARRA